MVRVRSSRPIVAALALLLTLLAVGLLPNRAAAAPSTFSNSAPIGIPLFGSATSYPATVSASGLSGGITALTVTLYGLDFNRPDDVDILLVGPTGAGLVIFSDVGGTTSVNNLTITLNDAAGSLLPDATTLASGTFKPTNMTTGGADLFPAPAPGSFASATPTGSATFASVFNGTAPNGIWSLYIVDDDDNGSASALVSGWPRRTPPPTASPRSPSPPR